MKPNIIVSTLNRHSTDVDKEIFLKLLKDNFAEYGYTLLSVKYINNNTPLEIMDENGLIFTQPLRNIRQHGFIKNHKISATMRKSKTCRLIDIKKVANERGGDLISNSYINNKT